MMNSFLQVCGPRVGKVLSKEMECGREGERKNTLRRACRSEGGVVLHAACYEALDLVRPAAGRRWEYGGCRRMPMVGSRWGKGS